MLRQNATPCQVLTGDTPAKTAVTPHGGKIKEAARRGRTLKDSFETTLPTDRKQKPQIDFLRFLCYNDDMKFWKGLNNDLGY